MQSINIMERLPASLRTIIENDPVISSIQQKGFSLSEILSSSAWINTLYEQMTGTEKRTLQLVVVHFGSRLFSMQEIVQLTSYHLSGAECKLGLYRLIQKGILFSFKKMWGEVYYLLPSDTLSAWQTECFKHKRTEMDVIPAEQVLVTKSAGRGIAYDLYLFIHYIAQHEMTITKKRTIHKKQIKQIMNFLNIQDQDLKEMKLNYAWSSDYPDAFAMIFDVALRLNLLEWEEDSIHLVPDAVLTWFQYSLAELQPLLYPIWEHIHFPVSLAMQHVVSTVKKLPLGNWYALESVIDWLMENGVECNKNSLIQEILAAWLKPMSALGWLDLGTNSQGMVLFQRCEYPSEREEQFYVQPDFEIIVPPTIPLSIRWELDWIAEPKKREHISTYHLSKDSFYYAIKQGRSEEELVAFLKKYAKYGVPETVLLKLKQWHEQMHKIQISQVVLVRCMDELVAEEIEQNDYLSSFIIEKIGNKDFIIQCDGVKMEKLLQQSGYSPLVTSYGGIQQCTISSSDFLNHSALNDNALALPYKEDNGLIYSPMATPAYEVNSILNDVEAVVYPNKEAVPAIWLQEKRNYHSSTKKEIIHQALSWNTYIKLWKNGEEIKILPISLQEEDRSWFLVGQHEDDELHIAPDQWQEMQLILLVINDT